MSAFTSGIGTNRRLEGGQSKSALPRNFKHQFVPLAAPSRGDRVIIPHRSKRQDLAFLLTWVDEHFPPPRRARRASAGTSFSAGGLACGGPTVRHQNPQPP